MSPFVKGHKLTPRKKPLTEEEDTTMNTVEERPTRDVPVERAARPARTPLGARNRLTFSGCILFFGGGGR